MLRFVFRLAPLTTLTLMLMTLGGCMSLDTHVFESTVWQPTTLRIETPVEHDLLWEKQIPVGYKLMVDFSSNAHIANDELDVDIPIEVEPVKVNMQPATKMKWRMYNARKTMLNVEEKGEVILPGIPIVMKIEYRDTPEYPGTYTPTVAPLATQPATYEQAATQPADDMVDEQAPAQPEADEPAAMDNDTEDAADAMDEIDAALDPDDAATDDDDTATEQVEDPEVETETDAEFEIDTELESNK